MELSETSPLPTTFITFDAQKTNTLLSPSLSPSQPNLVLVSTNEEISASINVECVGAETDSNPKNRKRHIENERDKVEIEATLNGMGDIKKVSWHFLFFILLYLFGLPPINYLNCTIDNFFLMVVYIYFFMGIPRWSQSRIPNAEYDTNFSVWNRRNGIGMDECSLFWYFFETCNQKLWNVILNFLSLTLIPQKWWSIWYVFRWTYIQISKFYWLKAEEDFRKLLTPLQPQTPFVNPSIEKFGFQVFHIF